MRQNGSKFENFGSTEFDIGPYYTMALTWRLCSWKFRNHYKIIFMPIFKKTLKLDITVLIFTCKALNCNRVHIRVKWKLYISSSLYLSRMAHEFLKRHRIWHDNASFQYKNIFKHTSSSSTLISASVKFFFFWNLYVVLCISARFFVQIKQYK